MEKVLRVPNQLLEKRRRHLEVKLEPQTIRTDAEDLVWSEVAESEVLAGCWNFKNIAMPVRRRKPRRQGTNDGIQAPGRIEFDREKSNLLLLGATDFGTKSSRDELRSQAKPDHRNAPLHGLPDHPAFEIQVGIFFHLPSTLPATTECQALESLQIWKHRLAPSVKNLQPDSLRRERFGQKPRLIDIPMLDEEHFFHASTLRESLAEPQPKKRVGSFFRESDDKICGSSISELPKRCRLKEIAPVFSWSSRHHQKNDAQNFTKHAQRHRRRSSH